MSNLKTEKLMKAKIIITTLAILSIVSCPKNGTGGDAIFTQM